MKGLQIVTAIVIIIAVLIVAGVGYTGVAQVYNKTQEKGESLMEKYFGPLLSFFTGTKYFTIKVDPNTYKLEKIEVVNEEGKTIKETKGNEISFRLDPDKQYSVKMKFKNILNQEIEVKSELFSLKEKEGKTIDFAGTFNGNNFVFMQGKVAYKGIIGTGKERLQPYESYALETKPIEVKLDKCGNGKTEKAEVEFDINCPDWDSGKDKAGTCFIYKAQVGACIWTNPSSWSTKPKGIGVNIENENDVCGLLYDSDLTIKDWPEDWSIEPPEAIKQGVFDSFCTQTNSIGVAEGGTGLNIKGNKGIKAFIYTYNPLEISTVPQEPSEIPSCVGSDSKPVSYKRGPCKFIFYYKKLCPIGYKFERGYGEGSCEPL